MPILRKMENTLNEAYIFIDRIQKSIQTHSIANQPLQQQTMTAQRPHLDNRKVVVRKVLLFSSLAAFIISEPPAAWTLTISISKAAKPFMAR